MQLSNMHRKSWVNLATFNPFCLSTDRTPTRQSSLQKSGKGEQRNKGKLVLYKILSGTGFCIQAELFTVTSP